MNKPNFIDSFIGKILCFGAEMCTNKETGLIKGTTLERQDFLWFITNDF